MASKQGVDTQYTTVRYCSPASPLTTAAAPQRYPLYAGLQQLAGHLFQFQFLAALHYTEEN